MYKNAKEKRRMYNIKLRKIDMLAFKARLSQKKKIIINKNKGKSRRAAVLFVILHRKR